ncbi:hypothetical protein ARMGADRAFT_168574 [Armillaria gallica]|uniref:VHS domain-containing protein n=1 Tax=Armillaria gallica TaxID=47427 RepID=A0A2H3DU57_ARMGA|nr:hypothetical protein ARMGADRAFT_168574 [Armillaria gallica]
MDENKDNGTKKPGSLPSYTHDMKKLLGRDKIKDLPSRNSSFSSLAPGASSTILAPSLRSPSLFTAEEETVPLLRTLDITRMIGLLTATTLEDWGMVLEVCERSSASDTNAKEAVSALRREFGKLVVPFFPPLFPCINPSPGLGMANLLPNYPLHGYVSVPVSQSYSTIPCKLWAIMLRNPTETFISQSTSKKFLGTLEDMIMSPRTSPVVRERVLGVIAAAAYLSEPLKTHFVRG